MVSTKRTIAFGDIHGCNIQLLEVLDQICPTESDLLIFLGDYIDRGPESEAVIRTIRELNAVYLTGNHELGFLSRWHRRKGSERSHLLEVSGLSPESVEWMENNLDLYYEIDTPWVKVLTINNYTYKKIADDLNGSDLEVRDVQFILELLEKHRVHDNVDKVFRV